MTKQKTIRNPNKKFWKITTIPDKNIKYTKDTVKILYDVSLSELLIKHKKRLHPEQIEILIKNIHKQMQNLNKNHMSVAVFDIDDIVVIENTFYFIDNGKILATNDKHIKINCVYKDDSMFVPHELNKNEHKSIHLPMILHQNSYMYSLALLSLFCLFNIPVDTRENASKVLEQLHGTELYWCLYRCLTHDDKNRRLLFI